MDDRQIIYGNCPSKSNCYKVVTINGHSSLSKTKALKEYEDKFYIQCDKYRNSFVYLVENRRKAVRVNPVIKKAALLTDGRFTNPK